MGFLPPVEGSAARRTIRRVVRLFRDWFTGCTDLAETSARDLFFSWVVGQAIVTRVPEHGSSNDLQVILNEIPSDVPGLYNLLPGHLIRELMPLAHLVALEPLNLGWAYQAWNDSGRTAVTFAISKGKSRALSGADVALATQLYTEEYMTRFLVERVLNIALSANRTVTDISLIDPACGSGHFLVEALRALRRRGITDSGLIERNLVSGVDVDPFAVCICRIALAFELSKIPGFSACDVIQHLRQQIVCAPLPFGTLDRATTEPVLQRSYTCLVTNPPFIGRRKLTDETRNFLDSHYLAANLDLCAAFMIRSLECLEPDGAVGWVTIDKWLRLRDYTSLRKGKGSFPGLFSTLSVDALCELGNRAFALEADLHDGVGILLLTGQLRKPADSHYFRYVDLTSKSNPEEKAIALCAETPGESHGVAVNQRAFLCSKGTPDILGASGVPPQIASTSRIVSDVAEVVVGLQTNDDHRFVRYQWQIPPDESGWLVHNKGGGYGRWYGFNRFVLNMGEGRPYFKQFKNSGLGCERWFDEEGWTYTWFAAGSMGLRRKEVGWSFGRATASGVFCKDDRIVAFLNSRLASYLTRRIGGKVQLPEGVVRRLPVPALDHVSPYLVKQAVNLKRKLIESDLLDVAFVPGQLRNIAQILATETLLLTVEATLEYQIIRSNNLSQRDLAFLGSTVGYPTGWYPLRASLSEQQLFWSAIPESERILKNDIYLPPNQASADKQSPHSPQQIAQGIHGFGSNRKHLNQSRNKSTIPTTGLVEFLSSQFCTHPIDMFLSLCEHCGSDTQIELSLCKPYVVNSIQERMLQLCGHRWRSAQLQKVENLTLHHHEARSSFELAHSVAHAITTVIPLSNRQFHFDDYFNIDPATWLIRYFADTHARTFLGSPLLLQTPIQKKADVTFTHIWNFAGNIADNRGKSVAS